MSFAGLALAASLFFVGTSMTACQPGKLPCDNPPECSDWVARLDDGGAPVGGTGGKQDSGTGGTVGGSGGGGTGAGGTGGGGTGGGSAVQVSGTTKLTNCTKATTVAEFETSVLAPTCTACHSGMIEATYPGDLKAADVFKRLIDQPSKKTCKGTNLVDTQDPAKSVLLITVSSSSPKCPDGSNALAMPLGTGITDPAVLDCYKAYISALTGKSVN